MTFREPFDQWGKCERCGASVPPAGVHIGFFGKRASARDGAASAS